MIIWWHIYFCVHSFTAIPLWLPTLVTLLTLSDAYSLNQCLALYSYAMTNTLKTPWVRFTGWGLGTWLSAQKGLLYKLQSLRSDSLAKAASFQLVESSYLEAVRQVAAIEENTQCAVLASACAQKHTFTGTLAYSWARSTPTHTCTRWGRSSVSTSPHSWHSTWTHTHKCNKKKLTQECCEMRASGLGMALNTQ